MAGASAAVGRRKASALRSARAASDDAANSFAPSGALPPLIFLEANTSCRLLPKLGCGCIARTRSLSSTLAGEDRSRPARSGEGSGIPAVPQALTRRAASRHAASPARGEGAASGPRTEKEETTMPTRRRKKSNERPHTPKRLTPEQESAQRKAAFAAIRALFCQVTQPWKSCQRGYCGRHHGCIAEAGPGACLGRHWPLLTPAEQKAAHFDVIDGGPRRQQPQTHTEWSLRRFPPSNFVH